MMTRTRTPVPTKSWGEGGQQQSNQSGSLERDLLLLFQSHSHPINITVTVRESSNAARSDDRPLDTSILELRSKYISKQIGDERQAGETRIRNTKTHTHIVTTPLTITDAAF